jgi:hypothetical protein
VVKCVTKILVVVFVNVITGLTMLASAFLVMAGSLHYIFSQVVVCSGENALPSNNHSQWYIGSVPTNFFVYAGPFATISIVCAAKSALPLPTQRLLRRR